MSTGQGDPRAAGGSLRGPLLAVATGLLVALAACGPGGSSAAGGGGTAPASGSSAREAAPPAAAASAPAPAAPPAKLRTAYTTAGATMASMWLAAEQGAFAEQGIDAEVVFIGAGQAILGALSIQEAPIVMAGANQMIEANLQGGEYTILGASMPYITNSIYVHPSIARPDGRTTRRT